jgi:hypothetical protein
MNKLRYNELMRGTASLTQDEVTQGWHFCPDWDFLLIGPEDEVTQGWHFCPDWDFLLIGPDSPEMECCTQRRTYEIRRQENLSSEKGRW